METDNANPKTLLTPEVEATSATRVVILPEESYMLYNEVDNYVDRVAALKEEMAEHTKEVNERLDRLENRLEILAGMLVRLS